MTQTQEQIENTQTIKNPNEAEYVLETPVKFGGQTVEKLIIRKPTTVALSGISLQDLYKSDVNALCTVIPKCVFPPIPREAIALIDPVDLGQIAGHIIYFLMPKSQRAQLNIQ